MVKNKYKLITYSGSCTFILLLLAFIWGIGGFNYKAHKYIAIGTVAFACLHVGIVIFVRKKRR